MARTCILQAFGLQIDAVELAPNRVIGEMVLDGGEHFIPAGIFGLHTLYLLLSPRAAHDRATEVTHQYKRDTHKNTIEHIKRGHST